MIRPQPQPQPQRNRRASDDRLRTDYYAAVIAVTGAAAAAQPSHLLTSTERSRATFIRWLIGTRRMSG